MSSIAFFITPHGFGHAARSCAVIQELKRMEPSLTFLILTTVPKEFFDNSLDFEFLYHPLQTDVGFIQRSALEIDMAATIDSLRSFYGSPAPNKDRIINLLRKSDTKLIISDISPLGIQMAQELGLRSILIENFTWDWIYRFYEAKFPQLAPISSLIEDIYKSASFRIRTIPYCGKCKDDLVVPPVSRCLKNSREATRKKLNVGLGEKMILVSMGGVSEELRFLNEGFLNELKKYSVRLVCCSDGGGLKNFENVIFLPQFSNYYHPDLVNASDGVIGKLGYSTVAEVANTGVPFAFVVREDYPEMDCLKDFVLTFQNTLEVNAQRFKTGNILEQVLSLLEFERIEPNDINGAEECAKFILQCV